MEGKAYYVSLEKNPIISIKVIPGHFTTRNAHVSHYLDVSSLKSNALIARDVARELAIPYISSILVDTIVCMENTKVIGAYLAEELLEQGGSVINSGGDIHVVTPMINIDGDLTFFDNELEWIRNKNILLLIATVSSGNTMRRALECIEYYGGRVADILALFMASTVNVNYPVHALFTSEDIQDHRVFHADKCEMCKEGKSMDAIVSSEGYKKIVYGGEAETDDV